MDLPEEINFEILQYYPYFRCLNKSYYHQGLHKFGNSKITCHEIINYKNTFCIYYMNGYCFEILTVKPSINYWSVQSYELTYGPGCISPDYYNNNVKLLKYTFFNLNRQDFLNKIYKKYSFLDSHTTNNILKNRFNFINTNLLFNNYTTDFNIMYSKICQLIYKLNINIDNINLFLNQYYVFKFGKLTNRHDEFLNYINVLDNYINNL